MTKTNLKTLQLVSVRWWNASAYYGISLTEALNKAGITCFAAGRSDSPPIEYARKLNLPTYTDINLETFNPFIFFKNIKNLKKYVRSNEINLLNAHRSEDFFYSIMTSLNSPNKIPVIRSVSDVRPPKNHRLNKWLHQNGADFLIFSCKASYDRYQSVWPIFENKSAVIYSAIDTDFFKQRNIVSTLRKKLNIKDEEIVVGIVARLSPVKDHFTFLKAASILNSKYKNLRFLISGEECQIKFDDLRTYAREVGIIDRTIIIEKQSDIRDLINCIDIGVITSNGSEVICRISVEFMAMGRPQVVTDINVLPEIIEEGKNGFIAPVGNAEMIANKLELLISNFDLRKKMGEKSREIAVKKYSYPVLAEKTTDIYNKVMI